VTAGAEGFGGTPVPVHVTLLHIVYILLENVITGHPLAGNEAKPVNSG